MKKVKFFATLTFEISMVLLLYAKYKLFWVDAFFSTGVFMFSAILMLLLNIKAKNGSYTAYQRARKGYDVPIENNWPIINPVILASGLFCAISLIVSGFYYL